LDIKKRQFIHQLIIANMFYSGAEMLIELCATLGPLPSTIFIGLLYGIQKNIKSLFLEVWGN